MSRDDARAVFQPGLALQQRLGEISRLRRDAHHYGKEHRALNRKAELGVSHEYESHVEQADDNSQAEPANCALDGFARADRWNQLLATECSPESVGPHVISPRQK